MAQPNKYKPQVNFLDDSLKNKPNRTTVSPLALDTEFKNIHATATGILENLAMIQRDDGELSDGVVKLHSLSRDVLMLLGNYELVGRWRAGAPYLKGQVVEFAGSLYVCVEQHNSNNALDLKKFKEFGLASGGVGSVEGYYFHAKLDDSYLESEIDSLIRPGVYKIENGAAYLMVFSDTGDIKQQIMFRSKSISLRSHDGRAWGDWAKLETQKEIVLPEAGIGVSGIVSLSEDYTKGGNNPLTAESVKRGFEAVNSRINNVSQNLSLISNSQMREFTELPIGTVIAIHSTDAPPGWVSVNGQYLNPNEYSELFGLFGYYYGKQGDLFRMPPAHEYGLLGIWNKFEANTGENQLGVFAQGRPMEHSHGVGYFRGTEGQAADDAMLLRTDWSSGTREFLFRSLTGDSQQIREEPSTGFHSQGIGTSPPIEVADVGIPRRWKLHLCMKAKYTFANNATDNAAGLVKIFQSLDGKENEVDGVLSAKAVKTLFDSLSGEIAELQNEIKTLKKSPAP